MAPTTMRLHNPLAHVFARAVEFYLDPPPENMRDIPEFSVLIDSAATHFRDETASALANAIYDASHRNEI